MEQADKDVFSQGIDLGDFVSKPARLEFTDNPENVYITICEGKFHQVKRMCEKCGKTVTYLKRVSIGEFTLPENFETGSVIEISKEELIDKIYAEKQ